MGRLNVNVAPLRPVLFSADILPPCASTILLEMYNPNPIPLSDFVTNLVNNLGNISASIPVPVSSTPILTEPASSFFSLVIAIVPRLVKLIALLNRLEMTWVILSLSASTNMLSSFLES
jgi:hypothetical protein